jgi:hypothetical protein
MAVLKITPEMLAAVGAKDESEFSAKLLAISAENTTLKEKVKEDKDDEKKEDDEAKKKAQAAAAPAAVTAESLAPMIAAEIGKWIGSEEGKKVLGASASKTVLEAMAATGTQPVKPAPAPAATEASDTAALVKAGKFDEAFKADENIRKEFPSAKAFAAYSKAFNSGAVKINVSK